MMEKNQSGKVEEEGVKGSGAKRKEKTKPWVIDLSALDAQVDRLNSNRDSEVLGFARMKGHLNEDVSLKDGLPRQAFAYVGSRFDTSTWLLPHHSKTIFRALKSKRSQESTVDWPMVETCVRRLSMRGFDGQHINAMELAIIDAAKHLADHYWWALKPLPNDLSVLI